MKSERGVNSNPAERVKQRRNPRLRGRVIDLAKTGEGQRSTDPTAPVDAEKLIRELKEIKEVGRRAFIQTHYG